MPKLTQAFPKYRRKVKPNGPQAVVSIHGTDNYLGPYGSKASKLLYDRLICEWLAAGRQPAPKVTTALTIEGLIARYWKYAKTHYRPKANKRGRANGTPERMKTALRMLKKHYGDTPAAEFGPVSLKAIRLQMIEVGNSRVTVNGDIDRIRRMFKWGVSEELIDESVYRRLATVDGLRKGRSDARESAPVPPVPDDVVVATLPYLPPVIADMVRFARYTGARPGEVCIIRPMDIDRSGTVWIYTPESHKTEHHDKTRAVVIGPKARGVIERYLERSADGYCFRPSEAVELYRMQVHATRKAPMNCGNRPGYSAASRAGRERTDTQPGDCYTNDSFRRAIHRACDRAFCPPEPLGQRPGETIKARNARLAGGQKEKLDRWQSERRWSPNQLRHSAATEIRQRFGIEAVAAVLGHSRTDTSEIYALRNLTLAASIAAEIG